MTDQAVQEITEGVQAVNIAQDATPAARGERMPQRGRGNRGRGRGGGPQRLDAERKFDRDQAVKGMEAFFDSWRPDRRANVAVHLHQDLATRLAQPYCEQAREYAYAKDLPVAEVNNHIHITSALVHFLAAKKLLMATPQSKVADVQPLWHLRLLETFGPKTLLTVIDQMGKFEVDKVVARVQYNTLYLKRWFLISIKQIQLHTRFAPDWRIHDDENPMWHDVLAVRDPQFAVFPDQDSVDWIKDIAKQTLRIHLRANRLVPMVRGDDDPLMVWVAPPQLDLDEKDPALFKALLLVWLGQLGAWIDNWEELAALGICLLIEPAWLKRPLATFHDLDPAIVGAIGNTTVSELLNFLLLWIPFWESDDYLEEQSGEFSEAIARVYGYLFESSMPAFNKYFKMAKQPDNAFGSAAQLIPISDSQTRNKTRIDIPDTDPPQPDRSYRNLPNSPEARVQLEVDNRSLVAMGLTFGYTGKVEWRDVLVGNLKGAQRDVQARYIASDREVFF